MSDHLMKEGFNPNGIKGTLTFNPDVIKTIAAIAALEIKGVAAISGGILDGIAQRLSNKQLYKGIKVEMEDEQVRFDIHLIVEYKQSIPEIYRNLKENLQHAFLYMTGLRVVEVNVRIDGIKINDEYIGDVAPK